MSNSRSQNSPLSLRLSFFILVGIILITLVGFGSLLGVLLITDASRSVSLTAIAFSFPLISLAILVFIQKYIHFHNKKWSNVGFVRPTKRLLHLLWQLPLLLCILLLVQVVVFGLLNLQPPSQATSIDTIMSGAPLFALVGFFIGVAILVPIWEEIFFRGIVYRWLRQKRGIALATILSSIIFATVHIAPILMPYLFTMGLAWVWLYEFHKTLWAPVIAHIFINSLVALPVVLFVLS